MSDMDRGCVKTPAPFHADLFCSLFRALRTFRIKKTAKNFALLGQPQKFVAFSHSLGPTGDLQDRSCERAVNRTSGEGVGRADIPASRCADKCCSRPSDFGSSSSICLPPVALSEDQRDLRAQLPVAAVGRLDNVVAGAERKIDRCLRA